MITRILCNLKGGNFTKQVTFLSAFIFIFIVQFNLIAQEKQGDKETTSLLQTEKKVEIPTIGQIIPKVTELSNRSLIIDNNLSSLVDEKKIGKQYAEVTKFLKDIDKELSLIKKEEHKGVNSLNKLRHKLSQEKQLFNNLNSPLTSGIEKVDKLRTDWSNDKLQWEEWEKHYGEEELPQQTKTAFKEANAIINKTLKKIIGELNILLKLQEKGYKNQLEINRLEAEVSSLLQEIKENAFADASIPMYSLKFYKQFDGKFALKVAKGVDDVLYPTDSFIKSFWWVIVFQLFITGSVILIIKNNREALLKNKKYMFLSDRSISSGIFFGSILGFFIYMFYDTPRILNFVMLLIMSLSFCRLISSTSISKWKKKTVYALNIVAVLTGSLNLFNSPVPLFRLLITGVSIFALIKIYQWYKRGEFSEVSKKNRWLIFPIAFYLLVIVISEIIGKEILALYMYESLLNTIVAVVFIYVFLEMVKAGIEGIFRMLTKRSLNPTFESINKGVQRVSTMVNVLVITFILIPKILVIWEVYENMTIATASLMSIGLKIGNATITLGVLIASIGVFYCSFVLSVIIEMLLMNESTSRQDLDIGTRLSISKLIRYFLVFFGFLLALTVLGFDLTNFTIVLSALGVGIGFGLQGVVNNFVSGLILLFERPVREGDSIQIGTDFSTIKKIGLRSTRVVTIDQADVIIPNSELVYNQVTNWTLTNRRAQIRIPVGVAYGSNVELVMKTLLDIALDNNNLFKTHKPNVLFRGFGDSTLDFELRVWTKEANDRLSVQSELLMEIDKRFRENNIEIAFPQRDLHIRSISPDINIGKS